MKKIIALSFATIVVLASCKKEAITPVKLNSPIESADCVNNSTMLSADKSVEQSPSLEKAHNHGKWTHSNGQEYVATWVLTIANDPAQEVEQLIFVPEPIKVETKDPKNPYNIIQLPSINFDQTFFNEKGVARFSSEDRIKETYSTQKIPGEWTCSGAIYSLNKGGKRNRICDFNLVRGPLNWK